MNVVHLARALDVLAATSDDSVDLIYVDPPFGTGNVQSSHGMSYDDDDNALYGDFITDHVVAFHRALKPTGTVYLHLDWRSVHLARGICDQVFGTENFLGEVIWAYNFGGRGKTFFAAKHDNVLVYAKHKGKHVFNYDDIDRMPYKAPEMQYVGRTKEEAEKRIARGQVPTDVWDLSIVGTNAKERTGYPTQKPLKLVERIVTASSPPGGLVMDVFAGSGTTGDAAHKHGRSFVLADTNPQAIEVMRERFKNIEVDWHIDT